MSIHIFRRLKNFFKITILGGFVAILPLALVIFIFRWLFSLIQKYLDPIVRLIPIDSSAQKVLAYIILITGILAVFFFIGLAIRTSTGRFFNKVLEDKYLSKIPGYKLARETVQQFFGKKKSFFSEVVLVDIFNSGTLMTGFVTDKSGDYVTLFVPTGPNPTSGNIYHVRKEKVIKTDAGIDVGMKTIISCGAGSSEIFKKALILKEKKSGD